MISDVWQCEPFTTNDQLWSVMCDNMNHLLLMINYGQWCVTVLIVGIPHFLPNLMMISITNKDQSWSMMLSHQNLPRDFIALFSRTWWHLCQCQGQSMICRMTFSNLINSLTGPFSKTFVLFWHWCYPIAVRAYGILTLVFSMNMSERSLWQAVCSVMGSSPSISAHILNNYIDPRLYKEYFYIL